MGEAVRIYRFSIDAMDPARLPMIRLAQYMTELAGLFGDHEHVHFDCLESGSTVLVQHVDDTAVPSVERRLHAAASNNPPRDIAKRISRINDRLAEDDARASLQLGSGAEVLSFLGARCPPRSTIGPLRQDGFFDGVLIRVGGRDDTVPVHLQDGAETHVCNATREMARRLAAHLFAGPIRVYGNGRWKRDAEGRWELLRFDIKHFELLDDAPLPSVVQALREIPGSGWPQIDDPTAELRSLRETSEHDL